MEYVGKLGSLITSVHNFYNEINPATLSGAIDIVVVEQEDGELACSPFHVRFGKLSVLMPQEKRVQIKVNDQVVPYVMKVGEAGEAFFVFETDYEVPEEFQTSPIMEAVPEVNQEGDEGEEPPFLDIGESKDQKEKKNDNDDGNNSNKTDNFDDEDEQKQQQENKSDSDEHKKESNKIPAELQSPKMIIDEQMDKVVTKMDPYHKKPDMDHDHTHGDDEVNSAIDTLKDTADELTHKDKPKNDVYKMDDGSTLLERVIPEAITTTMVAKERFVVRPASGDIYSTFMDVTHTSVHKRDDEKEARGEGSIMLDIAGYKTGSGGDVGDENWDEEEETILKEAELIDGVLQTSADEKKQNEIEHQKSVAEQILETQQQRLLQQQQQQTETQKKASSKNELPSSSTTTSWGWGETRKHQEGDKEEEKEEEEKDKSDIFNADAQVKSVELQPGQTYRIELSLCGFSAFGVDEDENARLFEESQITYDKFTHNPNILNDRRLVFRYQGRYYAASHTGPLLTSLLLFKKPLEDVSRTDSDSEDDMADSRESYQFGKGWRQWLSRSSVAAPTHNEGHQNEDPAAKEEQETTTFTTTTTTTSVGWSADHVHPHGDDDTSSNEDPFPVPRKVYAKTLRLTSDQLKSLHLKKGVNDISFSVSSAYQGTATCAAKIFFWDYDIQIVISDIDGTITKSDTLGHVFTMIGKDWTHLGVANLYTDIANNGYHMLYLTSRAIGQADYTRDYLKKIEQGNYQLPDGPVIMSPDRLFTSLHREVIMRKPEVFKMACLKDIQRLFGGRDPFYAGFGNRITDARSYRSVNVPTSRIFTIDPYGDLKLELLMGFKSSYIHLNDLVDQIFPPINRAIDEEYNDWNYWKSPVPEIDIPELDEPLEPTSPKPKPIKPDPSSLPDHAVVGASQNNKSGGAGGLLRSFTSRSSNNLNINTTNSAVDNNKKKYATIQASYSTPTLSSSGSSSSSNNYSSSSLNTNIKHDSDSELSGRSIPMEHSVSETTLLKNTDNKNNNNNSSSSGGGIMNKMIRTFLSSDNNDKNKNEAKTKENEKEEEKDEEDEEVENNEQELDDIMDDIDMSNIPFI